MGCGGLIVWLKGLLQERRAVWDGGWRGIVRGHRLRANADTARARTYMNAHAKEACVMGCGARVGGCAVTGLGVGWQPLQRKVSAHVRGSRGSRGGAGRSAAQGKGRGSDSQQSVTSVLFVEANVLASAGANDGTVKLWD